MFHIQIEIDVLSFFNKFRSENKIVYMHIFILKEILIELSYNMK